MSKKAKLILITHSSAFACLLIGVLCILISRNHAHMTFQDVPATLWAGYTMIFVAGVLLIGSHFVMSYHHNERRLSKAWFIIIHVMAIYTVGMFSLTMIADSFTFIITSENFSVVSPLNKAHQELLFLLKELTYVIGLLFTSFLAILYYGAMNAAKK
jgi:hypothetical protein